VQEAPLASTIGHNAGPQFAVQPPFDHDGKDGNGGKADEG
jgi:hypothetical protein